MSRSHPDADRSADRAAGTAVAARAARPHPITPWQRWAGGVAGAALLALGVLAGCGGGGDAAGGSTTTTSATSGSTSGNTSGSSTSVAAAYTEGTVSGFGSIIVNGVRFDDSAVTATDDSGLPTMVKLGMRVEVQSTGVTTSSTAVATAVRVRGGLVGPVEVPDTSGAATGSVTVLGQVVDIGEGTVFDSSLSTGLAALTTGTVVGVHGIPDTGTGHLLATRVESKAGATAYRLQGSVSALDTVAMTLTIGSAVVDYSSATGVPADLAVGSSVRLLLSTTANSAGQWVATGFGSTARGTTTATAARIRGAITVLTDATHFTVDGIPVDASAVASLPATLAVGVEVEVSGTLTNGTLIASAVSLKAEHRGHDARRYDLHGTVSALDTTAQTFVLRGITVSYASASFSGGLSAASLVDGLRVEVRGTPGSSRDQLTASTIEPDDH